MITGEILKLISIKLRGIVWSLFIIGLLFFILAVAVFLYPQVLQYLFTIAFFIFAFASFLIAIKINNIKESFDNLLRLVSRKQVKK